MKTINNLRDLSHYGIDPLTGEACGLGMRILCDLTHVGRRIVCKALSIKPEGLEDGWNSRGVASIMLGYDSFRELATFALLDEGGCHLVAWTPKSVIGFEKGDDLRCVVDDPGEPDYRTLKCHYEYMLGEHATHYGEPHWLHWHDDFMGKVERTFKYQSYQHGSTGRVQHAMSGRVA